MMDLLENGVNDTCHHCLCHLIAGNEINFIFICSTTSLSATKVHYWPLAACRIAKNCTWQMAAFPLIADVHQVEFQQRIGLLTARSKP